mgnify:CR=1 FL=1
MWAIWNNFFKGLSLHFWRKCDIHFKGSKHFYYIMCLESFCECGQLIYKEGEIIANTVIDISEALERYRFDEKYM